MKTSPTRSPQESSPGLCLYSGQRVQSQALSLGTSPVYCHFHHDFGEAGGCGRRSAMSYPPPTHSSMTTSPTRSPQGSSSGLCLYSGQRVQSQALSLSPPPAYCHFHHDFGEAGGCGPCSAGPCPPISGFCVAADDVSVGLGVQDPVSGGSDGSGLARSWTSCAMQWARSSHRCIAHKYANR